MVYSGDTGYCDEIIRLSEGADLLVLEASFPDGNGVEGHLTPSEAGRIATKAGIRRLVLTHFYPECMAMDIVSQCRGAYEGEIIQARDALRLTV